MYPENEPNLASNAHSADYPSPSGKSMRPDKEGTSMNVDKSVKDAQVNPDEFPPNTTNSSTMTSPDWQYPNWPPHYVQPFQYPYGGVFCCPPPPPLCINAPGCNCSFQNVPPHGHCNNVSTTSSGISVGTSNRSHSNTNSTRDNEHIFTPNHSYGQTMPYPYPTFYAPNHMLLQNSLGVPIILATGHLVPPNHMGNARHNHSRHSLCCNCSNEILPAVDESNAEEISCRTPLKITSFTDSIGRTWKCVDTKARKAGTVKGKEKTENVLLAGSRRYCNANENSTKKSTIRSRVASPCRERPLTANDNPDFPQRKKKTKVRVRKTAEEVNLSLKTAHLPPSRSLQTNTSNIIKPVRTLNHMCINSSFARRSTSHIIKTSKKTLKDAASLSNVKNCQKNESQELLLTEQSCSQMPPTISIEERVQHQTDLQQSKRREVSPTGVSPGDRKQHAVLPNSPENTVPGGASTVPKSTTGEANAKNDEPSDKASCNDFLKKSGVRKDTQSVQCSPSLKEDEFWSSSSSSGTYDDSEAFDSYKLLNDAQLASLRQSRQRSRDRLFRRRVGLIRFSNTRSEEDLRKKRRSFSPKMKDKDERPKEQVIIDTSKVRITEETPKRFIVESKDGASTSQKGMTITVQAEVPRGNSNEVCEIHNTGGQQVSAGVSCSCEVPPCQQPQWQAPLCPANEIHGTPVHQCHNMPPTGRTPARQTSPHRHHHTMTNISRIEHNSGENATTHDIEDYHRIQRRTNNQNFNFPVPWGQRNVDRPREENRYQSYIPPHPLTERLNSIRRDHGGPTNRTRRWHTQSELPLGDIRGSRQPDESVRIQIPNSFPRYRPYEYARNHSEEPVDSQEGMEENAEIQNRNTIDINIYRNGGVRRLGTVHRVIQCNSPRTRGHRNEEAGQTEDDPEGNLDFYRRPRSAITVSKTNYVSPRNRQLEEEVQRIQSSNYGHDLPSTSAKDEEDEETEYQNKNCEDDQESEDGEKPDCEYEEIDGNKRDEDTHHDIEDED